MSHLKVLFGAQASVLRTRQFKLLLLGNVNAALGTVLVSPLLDSLTGPFAVSDVRIGLLMTAFTAPSVVGIPVVGMVSDRVGRKAVLVSGLLLFGLSGAAVALTTDFRVALALRMLQGVGYAGITPVIITAIGDLYDGSREATAQGLRFASSGLSQAAFPLLAGLVVGLAWQYPFAIYLLAVPAAGLVAVAFEEPRPTPEPEPSAGDAAPDGGSAPDGRAYVRSLLRLCLHPKIGAVLVAFTVPAFLYMAFLTYNSFLVVRVLDSSPGVAGVLTTVVSLIYALTASQAGRISDYFGSRVIPLVVGSLCMGGGLSLAAMAGSVPVAMLGIAVMGTGIGLAFALLRSVLTRLAPEQFRGGLVGVGESVIRLANTIAPVALGWLVAVFGPMTGPNLAIRYSLLVVGVGGAAVGVVAMLAARAAAPVTGR